MLEPGDATRYEFSLTPCDNHGGAISGVGDGHDYMTLVLHSPGTGSYEVSSSFLRDPQKHRAIYLLPHFRCLPYAIMAILLACSVLVDDPDNVTGACEQMLRVSEYLP